MTQLFPTLSPTPTSQPGNTHLLLSLDLPVLDISYERNQPVGELVCPASFIQQDVLEVHPCGSMAQDPPDPFHG